MHIFWSLRPGQWCLCKRGLDRVQGFALMMDSVQGEPTYRIALALGGAFFFSFARLGSMNTVQLRQKDEESP